MFGLPIAYLYNLVMIPLVDLGNVVGMRHLPTPEHESVQPLPRTRCGNNE